MDKAIRHRVNAARVALLKQVEFFGNQFGKVVSEWKPDDSRVTFADFAISEILSKELRKDFPNDPVCSEESNPLDEVIQLDQKYTWILDPIDGTNNYALGIPFCSISLALLKDGIPVYGFIYDFALDHLIEGGKGYGLYLGKKKLPPPSLPDLDSQKSVIGFHFPVPAGRCERLQELLTKFRIRSLGSAALNFLYVALGKMDGTIDFKVKVWDIAGAVPILEAAGLEMHFLTDSPFPLKTFHADSPKLECYAGSSSFVEAVKTWI